MIFFTSVKDINLWIEIGIIGSRSRFMTSKIYLYIYILIFYSLFKMQYRIFLQINQIHHIFSREAILRLSSRHSRFDCARLIYLLSSSTEIFFHRQER